MIIAADDNTSFIVVELCDIDDSGYGYRFYEEENLNKAEKLNYGSGVKVQMKHDRWR